MGTHRRRKAVCGWLHLGTNRLALATLPRHPEPLCRIAAFQPRSAVRDFTKSPRGGLATGNPRQLRLSDRPYSRSVRTNSEGTTEKRSTITHRALHLAHGYADPAHARAAGNSRAVFWLRLFSWRRFAFLRSGADSKYVPNAQFPRRRTASDGFLRLHSQPCRSFDVAAIAAHPHGHEGQCLGRKSAYHSARRHTLRHDQWGVCGLRGRSEGVDSAGSTSGPGSARSGSIQDRSSGAPEDSGGANHGRRKVEI